MDINLEYTDELLLISELTILPQYTMFGDLIWTVKEDQRLMNAFFNCSKEQLLRLFPDRTWLAIKHRINKFNLKRGLQRWSKEEDQRLRNLSERIKDTSKLSTFFPNRTLEAVRTRYYRFVHTSFRD